MEPRFVKTLCVGVVCKKAHIRCSNFKLDYVVYVKVDFWSFTLCLFFFPFQWTILKGNSSTNGLNLLKTVSNEVIFKYLRGKNFKIVWEGRLFSTNSNCLLPIWLLLRLLQFLFPLNRKRWYLVGRRPLQFYNYSTHAFICMNFKDKTKEKLLRKSCGLYCKRKNVQMKVVFFYLIKKNEWMNFAKKLIFSGCGLIEWLLVTTNDSKFLRLSTTAWLGSFTAHAYLETC